MQAQIFELLDKVQKQNSDIEESKRLDSALKEKYSKLEETIRNKNDRLAKFQIDIDTANAQTEEKVLYLQMHINNVRTKDDARDKETASLKSDVNSLRQVVIDRDHTVGGKSELIETLQNKIFEIERDLDHTRDKMKESERNLSAMLLLKAEQESLLMTLRRDLRSASSTKDDSVKRIKELEEYRLKAEDAMIKVTNLSEKLTSLECGIEEKTSLITRLRAESQVAER